MEVTYIGVLRHALLFEQDELRLSHSPPRISDRYPHLPIRPAILVMVFCQLYAKGNFGGELATKPRNGPYGEGGSSGPEMGCHRTRLLMQDSHRN
jgi:hypothetical protein